MDDHLRPPSIPPPGYDSQPDLLHYSPANDAAKLDEEDKAKAGRRRGDLQKIFYDIVQSRKHLSPQDQNALETWIGNLWTALRNASDVEWNFYHDKNWRSIKTRFEGIRDEESVVFHRKSRPELRPISIVKDGVVREGFVVGGLIGKLNLETIYDGRRKELLDLLQSITDLAQPEIMSITAHAQWFGVIYDTILHDEQNLVVNSKWYAIMAVADFIRKEYRSHIDTLGRKHFPTQRGWEAFLRRYPPRSVLVKMGVPAIASRSLGHSKNYMTHRQRLIYKDL
ncbi:uncharacterized protein JCM6883_005691 [Sporobolomyces salmoneus]|uniref:uncharacterized protein n=1 Tax=Sporobolomyces salmoneus TaxID=183962 RepID=UPI00317D2854